MGDLDTASLLFALPDGIFISSVGATPTQLVVQIACRRSDAACPLCQQLSERVHGHYGRTVADLPWAGRRVICERRGQVLAEGTIAARASNATDSLCVGSARVRSPE